VAEALEELGPQERRLHTRHRMQRRSLCRDDECHSPGSPAFATPSRSPARQQPPAPAQHQHRADDADAEGLRVSGFRWGSPERARPPAELSSALRSWRHALEDADAHVRQGRRALDAWGAAPTVPGIEISNAAGRPRAGPRVSIAAASESSRGGPHATPASSSSSSSSGGVVAGLRGFLRSVYGVDPEQHHEEPAPPSPPLTRARARAEAHSPSRSPRGSPGLSRTLFGGATPATTPAARHAHAPAKPRAEPPADRVRPAAEAPAPAPPARTRGRARSPSPLAAAKRAVSSAARSVSRAAADAAGWALAAIRQGSYTLGEGDMLHDVNYGRRARRVSPIDNEMPPQRHARQPAPAPAVLARVRDAALAAWARAGALWPLLLVAMVALPCLFYLRHPIDAAPAPVLAPAPAPAKAAPRAPGWSWDPLSLLLAPTVPLGEAEMVRHALHTRPAATATAAAPAAPLPQAPPSRGWLRALLDAAPGGIYWRNVGDVSDRRRAPPAPPRAPAAPRSRLDAAVLARARQLHGDPALGAVAPAARGAEPPRVCPAPPRSLVGRWRGLEPHAPGASGLLAAYRDPHAVAHATEAAPGAAWAVEEAAGPPRAWGWGWEHRGREAALMHAHGAAPPPAASVLGRVARWLSAPVGPVGA
jgi:hypothetical protein